MYKQYTGDNLYNLIRYRYPKSRAMQLLCKETVLLIIENHKALGAICSRLSGKFWGNKDVLKRIKEVSDENDKTFYGDMLYYFPEEKYAKIEWLKKRRVIDNGEKTHRGSTPVGNLRWREKGFKRQEVNTEIPNPFDRFRQADLGFS